MRSTRMLFTGAAVAAVLLSAAPLAAAAPAQHPTGAQHSAPATASVEADPVHAASDGNLYLYYKPNRQQQCGAYAGSTPSLGACARHEESLWNNGYAGGNDDVLVYWGAHYTGAHRGVYNGVVLNDLRQWTFDPGGSHAGERLWHNILSVQWVDLP